MVNQIQLEESSSSLGIVTPDYRPHTIDLRIGQNFGEADHSFGNVVSMPQNHPSRLIVGAEGTGAINIEPEVAEQNIIQARAAFENPIPRHRLLNAHTLGLAKILWTIIVSKALQTSLEVLRGALGVEEDPEERTSQLVLRIYVDATPAQTLAFWDSLDIELDRWLIKLNQEERQTVVQKIGLRFLWP